jgi:cyanophycin synthetase
VLANPDVTAAVFEASADGILRDGLGFDKCDVAIVTNLALPDHLGGEFDIYDAEKMFAVKRTPVDVVMEHGAAVLNASDVAVMEMKPLSKGDVILFAIDSELPTVQQHLSDGKRAVVLSSGAICLCTGSERESLLDVSELAIALHGAAAFQIENVMAAIAAAWHLRIDLSLVKQAVLEAVEDAALSRRLSVTPLGNKQRLVCDVDNAAGLQAVVQTLAALAQLSQQPGPAAAGRAIVYACRNDRRREDLLAQGELLAKHFEHIYLYDEGGGLSTELAAKELVAEGAEQLVKGSDCKVAVFRCQSSGEAMLMAMSDSSKWLVASASLQAD